MTEPYIPAANRYDGVQMPYARCGQSGVLLPRLSLGLWKNFGVESDFTESRRMVLHAFDHGVTHFDLANNYGPPYGSAEETFGRIMDNDLRSYRDELFVATKAGYDMWPGPYGNWGSRKYLHASLDQSLKRMQLDYVDLFYIHRFDPLTPLDETLQALTDVVRQGKALYVGISRWPLEAFRYGVSYLRKRNVPCLIYQGRLNLLDRAPQREGIVRAAQEEGTGFIGFSPLAQGLLTDRYLHGIPKNSRMHLEQNLKSSKLTPQLLQQLAALRQIAAMRGERLVQMALAWVLAQCGVTSVIVGASSVVQLSESLKAAQAAPFSAEELEAIDNIVGPAVKPSAGNLVG